MKTVLPADKKTFLGDKGDGTKVMACAFIQMSLVLSPALLIVLWALSSVTVNTGIKVNTDYQSMDMAKKFTKIEDVSDKTPLNISFILLWHGKNFWGPNNKNKI